MEKVFVHCPNCGHSFMYPPSDLEFEFDSSLKVGDIQQPMFCSTCDDYTVHENGTCMRCFPKKIHEHHGDYANELEDDHAT